MQGDHPLTAAALGLLLLAVAAGACETAPVPAARVAAANDLNSSRERVGTEWAASSDRSAQACRTVWWRRQPGLGRVQQNARSLYAGPRADQRERDDTGAAQYVAHLTARDVYQDLCASGSDGDAPHREDPAGVSAAEGSRLRGSHGRPRVGARAEGVIRDRHTARRRSTM